MIHIIACSLGVAVAAAHAFDPTPADQMRPMATDRPDLTESAVTVDAGHLQLEMDLVVATFEAEALGFDFAVANLKLGLTPSMDLQLVVPSLGVGVGVGPKAQATTAAFADPLLRFKWNLLGNDGGDIGLALMPWVSVAAADLAWSGGLIVPLSFALPAELTLSTMWVLDVLQDGAGLDIRGSATASLSRAIIDGLGVYVETLVTGTAYAQTGAVLLSSGVTWLVQPDLQLDAGLRGPVAGEPPRLETFVGFSIRR